MPTTGPSYLAYGKRFLEQRRLDSVWDKICLRLGLRRPTPTLGQMLGTRVISGLFVSEATLASSQASGAVPPVARVNVEAGTAIVSGVSLISPTPRVNFLLDNSSYVETPLPILEVGQSVYGTIVLGSVYYDEITASCDIFTVWSTPYGGEDEPTFASDAEIKDFLVTTQGYLPEYAVLATYQIARTGDTAISTYVENNVRTL